MNMGVVEAGGRVFSVGGTNWSPGSWVGNLDMYDPASDSWSAEPAMPTTRTDLGAGVVGGIIYAVGGYNTTDVSVVEAYDPSTRTWSARSPMPIARSGVAIGVANGILYAVGGRVKGSGVGYSRASPAADRGTRAPASSRIAMDIVGSGNALGILEGYDPSTDRWTELPPMPTRRSHLGVGVLNGIVYAVGGSDGTTTFATVEAFDPATGRWTTVAPLHEARALLSVAVLGGKLYAIGGIPVYIGSPVVEVYDPLFNTWSSAPLMLIGRMSAGAVALNGLIYAIGGACDYTALQTVEAFTQ